MDTYNMNRSWTGDNAPARGDPSYELEIVYAKWTGEAVSNPGYGGWFAEFVEYECLVIDGINEAVPRQACGEPIVFQGGSSLIPWGFWGTAELLTITRIARRDGTYEIRHVSEAPVSYTEAEYFADAMKRVIARNA